MSNTDILNWAFDEIRPRLGRKYRFQPCAADQPFCDLLPGPGYDTCEGYIRRTDLSGYGHVCDSFAILDVESLEGLRLMPLTKPEGRDL
jgi:hypothetical protein